MSDKSTPSLLDRSLDRLAGFVLSHRRGLLIAHAFLFVIAVLITATGLEFSMDRNALVGEDKHYHQNFLRLKEEFPLQDDLVVVVESENREKNRQFVERLGAKLRLETNLVHNVFWKGDLPMLGPKAPSPDL